ncbi:aspergillopepsin I [Sporothrix brasiliensis 5110]|uniref:Aspergillopepsin I n=1 Tax=Sporothrix brasiliensis 5110 TaxID=1398154 RepID=A0A0C2IU63_9PEZI|nr:aspergillopepsin I [Sporothrix brasiliensis 5110]KIH92646.1 aspergillopepsin I [Sporothrix brasiliensis 5110]
MRSAKRSFKVERVRNAAYAGHNTPKQLMKAHLKYGVRPPQNLVARLNAQEVTRLEAITQSKRIRGHKHGNGSGKAVGNGNGNGNGNNNANANGKANSSSTATIDNGNSTTGATTSTTSTNSTSTNTAVAAAVGSGVGIVTNTPTSGDVEYLSPVSIGGQTLNMDFDTGSSDLWVFNTGLSAAQSRGHTLFDSTKSTTFTELTGQTFSISYGDGSAVSGTVGTDVVNIGGASVAKQAVELATQVSSSFVSDTASNGLVGLAFSKLNTVKPTQQKTFFDNVQESLASPVFTANLRHGAAGSYEFGTIDSTQFNGTMHFAAVNTSQGFWQFSSSKFAIGNGAVQTSGAGQAIADTGTTLLLASDKIVTAYYSSVTGAQNNQMAGGITVPCNADLPDLHLDVGGNMATVRGTDIMFEQVTGNTCFGGLQAIDSDLMIFGDVFFKSNFVAFNLGNNTVGFASHA